MSTLLESLPSTPGGFWTSVAGAGQRDIIRRLTEMAGGSLADPEAGFGDMAAWWLGVARAAGPWRVPLVDARLGLLGADPNLRNRAPDGAPTGIRVAGYDYGGADDGILPGTEGPLRLPSVAASTEDAPTGTAGLAVRWLLEVPAMPVRPVLVDDGGSDPLLVGVGFSETPGGLVLHLLPDSLVTGSGDLRVRKGCRRSPGPLAFPFRVDSMSSGGRWVARYLRSAQTPGNLAAAAAEASGLAVVGADAFVHGVWDAPGGGRFYATGAGLVEVPYDHEAVPVGTFWTAGHVPGGVLRVSAAAASGAGRWWRGVDWSDGLSLDNLCPFRGITVPDGPVVVSVTAGGPYGAVLLSSPEYDFPDAPTRDGFLSWLHECEARAGVGMASLLGLTSGASGSFPVLDLLMDNWLGSRLIVVEVASDLIGDERASAIRSFVLREAPAGMIPVVLERRNAIVSA